MQNSNSKSGANAVRHVIFQNSPTSFDVMAHEMAIAREREQLYGAEARRIRAISRWETALKSCVMLLGIVTLATLATATWTLHTQMANADSPRPGGASTARTWDGQVSSLLAAFGASSLAGAADEGQSQPLQ